MTQTTDEQPFCHKRWMARMSAMAAPKVGFTPGEWHAWLFTAAEQGGLFVTGACCPPITRGPRKGRPNYKKRDRNTERRVYLTKEECLG